jgi:AcrR family transcriptional regulator
MEKKTTSKLGRQDWLTIGLKALIEKGVNAVRVDPLAKKLNVTRGSFYWHFTTRDDLLEAILQEWETLNTKRVIEQIEAIGNDPDAKLMALLEVAAQDDNRLEKAVRVWAANDVKAAVATARIDQQRLDYLQNLFLQLGFSATDARVRAQVVYSFRLGWFIMPSSKYSEERLEEIGLVYKIVTQANPS